MQQPPHRAATSGRWRRLLLSQKAVPNALTTARRAAPGSPSAPDRTGDEMVVGQLDRMSFNRLSSR
jgi:hypothetical protein